MSNVIRDVHTRYSYNTIFSDICKTRFNNMIVRFFLSITFIQTLLITLASRYNASWIQGILLFFPKYLALYFVAICLIISRKNFLHVNSLGYSSFVTQIVGGVCSFKAIVYYVTYSVCSIMLGNSIGDNRILYSLSFHNIENYRLYTWFLIPLVYTVQHVFFDADKLTFSIDSQYQAPQQYITLRLEKILIKSSVLSVILLLAAPLTYKTLGWSMFLPIITQIQLLILSFILFLQFEIINVTFNAHMSIGCLHKGKPISSLSPSPIETLVSGLSSKKPFTKLTAFQELSYRATSNDTSLRLPIYSSQMKNTNPWSNILTECIRVIQTNNITVNNYLTSLENTMSKNKRLQKDTLRKGSLDEHESDIFGNQPFATNKEFNTDYPSNVSFDSNINGVNAHRISLHDDNILLNRRKNSSYYNQHSFSNMGSNNLSGLDAYRSYNETIITRDPKIIILIKTIINKIKNSIVSFFFPASSNNKDSQLPQLTLFDLWYLSKERQAEKLIPLAVCHMESIVSLMGFLIKAIDESPKGSVVASVGEVLKHLEKSVAILGKFNEWRPESNTSGVTSKMNGEDESTKSNDVISLLYELSISAFLEIVLKYNVLLNDVYLDEDVIKLSKWVLDMCAEEQDTISTTHY
ncbi:similar to Saccharomyces cerevisiae YML031W NDC1 Nuclear envelope protein with multiple putative transmembrane domains [Maudiozyma saulgeensis]|uniref:Similar to Saccharomyces cerevisiae YML031W NDC1 Nuclear envelope protein with multiple putative transmembrane domains n=1 Tax=Maudiozyma saulgeensis TaxID=1789683 RepID=A0A1X7QXB5_9SACH|nr:similar to Saccharomyces cerevisiae YML031W NDC1 Nuclear envelope protein with multiple putative transmembrane domains [Kazachstania saulgeensis]